MNIDVAKQEFMNYINNFDLTDFNIKRKVDHSLRVMALCSQIAKSLNLDDEDVELATLIGLLHDIGRFEQFTIYGTYSDKSSIDHGIFGVEILKKDNYIRNYIEEEKYDEIIFKVIKNHNKFRIEEGLSEKQIMFCNIIRDADKLDILYQGTCISWANNKFEVEDAVLKKDNIIPFYEKRLVNRDIDLKGITYGMKHLLIQLGFVFDLNYKISFEILNEKGYIKQIIDRFNFKYNETKELIDEVVTIVNDYIDSKIVKG